MALPDPHFDIDSNANVAGHKRILVVDDEKHIVRLAQVNLERVGYAVVTALDGKEALDKVASEQPDLVVLDVMMPHVDGFEVLRTLRANEATRDLPVVMLTAKAQDADVFMGWKGGVSDYLTKPFNPIELISIVNGILRRGNAGEDGMAPVGLQPNPPIRPALNSEPLPGARDG